ncbi:MAG TPA: hypothetical protein PLO63_02115 [Syntrophales bacterium]|mgnify:CR=1 FL=1|nr:hypothetical protein [Syntrophales bacterium]
MDHNRKVWGSNLCNPASGEILIETTSMASSIIAFSYLANVLAKKHGAKIVAYLLSNGGLRSRLSNRKLKRLYKSFNTRDFISCLLSSRQREEAERLFQDIYPLLRTKRDVEDLRVEGLWIGDLLYDSHCMNYKVPTITLYDVRFGESLKNALSSYVFWRDYFNAHPVRSVIVSHTVYIQSGVVTRLAIRKGIPVYQINATHLHYLTEKNLWAYNEFFYYPEQFRELPMEERERGLEIARERIGKRLSGEVGVDMPYSSKTAYGRIGETKVLRESSRIKILVATHCFFDNPHPYGVNLFPDFYEWLHFLGEISKQTDYDWYIKTHPDFLPGNIPIIEEFIRKYPKFTMIPSDTSHLQLKKEGIDFGLTVYGTIGFEYAALGISVINASLCNPRIRYNFNVHPQSIDEYRNIIFNLSAQKLDIDLNEVYEYYFMAFVHNVNDWLYRDYDGFIRRIGGYYKQYDPVSYQVFRDEFSEERHRQILSIIHRFVDSGEYNLRRKFLDQAA